MRVWPDHWSRSRESGFHESGLRESGFREKVARPKLKRLLKALPDSNT